MKLLSFTTYWLMVTAVIGGIHAQHGEKPAGIFQPVSPEPGHHNSHSSCQSTYQFKARISVADGECYYKPGKLQ